VGQVRLILEQGCLFQMNFGMHLQQICYFQPCLLCELICKTCIKLLLKYHRSLSCILSDISGWKVILVYEITNPVLSTQEDHEALNYFENLELH